ncbi:glycoside hydrolase family 55 protein [Xylariaceae sp. FL0255]|nr:glycoside hydrolase family 55 protein [Xylariaceae sp. FL0255]
MRFSSFLTAVAGIAAGANAYWLGDIDHQGVAPFASSGYKVFRNVMDYGATGDGSTDDTAAIQAALDDGGDRCAQGCDSTTTTPAVVYFPAGTYVLSGALLPPYFTQMIGDPTDVPTLKATSNFAGFGLIDGNHYYGSDPNWVTTNVFYTSVRNFIIDTTAIPAATAATGIHWPTSQATSLINIVFNMPTDSGVVHVGLFCESGSGGFMSDLTFNGGATGASLGNQQYTMRNLEFNNCGTAIITLWDWGWTYAGLTIKNCGVGIDMTAAGSTAGSLTTGAVTLIDSTISNTPIGIKSAKSSSTTPATAGSMVLENVVLDGVSTAAVQGPDGVLLAGGSSTISAWAYGNAYTPTSGPTATMGTIAANSRPASLVSNGNYYATSKPQYTALASTDFVSVRSSGAKGDGSTDDTAAIQSAINSAASGGKVVFLDYGLYVITDTISVPDGTKIIGEGYPVLMASGSKFGDITSPVPMLQVGATSGASGTVWFSDFVVGTKGSAPGAVLIEWNLASPSGSPSGMWDVHGRVGGFTGSDLQVAQCPTSPGSSSINTNCIGAYMQMHITASASGLYMENTWFWTADHDIDDASNTQVTIFTGRGLYCESTVGTFWMYGTAVEHNELYNYQFANTNTIFASMFQTETPYYQPSPSNPGPWTINSSLNDPTSSFAWGLRIYKSSDMFIYGAGHYSFFSNYDSTTCPTFAGGDDCQTDIVSIESSSNINIYSLNTIGSVNMIDVDGSGIAKATDNENVYPSTIILFRT